MDLVVQEDSKMIELLEVIIGLGALTFGFIAVCVLFYGMCRCIDHLIERNFGIKELILFITSILLVTWIISCLCLFTISILK